MPIDGLISIASAFSVDETMRKLVDMIEASGQTVFAQIDHGRNATQVGLALRPTQLVLFGNPKAGTPLMQDRQEIGIDLPLRILVWEASDGQVWLSYDDPAWLARRHELSQPTDATIQAIRRALAKVAAAAAGTTGG